MQLTFLGTAAMVPTKDRNVQGIHLEYKGEGILIDCGEGTQRQMNIAGINRQKLKKILISHWHGDHIAGLIGLIQTLGNIDEPGTLHIYGPQGSEEYLGHLLKCCAFDLRIEIKLTEIKAGEEPVRFYENEDYELHAVALRHSIPCLGYSLIEKDKRKINLKKTTELGIPQGPLIGRLQRGETIEVEGRKILPDKVSTIQEGKKIAFVLDTEACAGINNLARDADVLVAEATYESSLDEKAEEYKHMTAQTVAQIASQEGVQKLVLTHFSQRYKDVSVIEEDARKVFPDTICAYDFMQLQL